MVSAKLDDLHGAQQWLSVSAPSRLHFGLLAFGGAGRQFGGAGVMLDAPRVRLTIEPSRDFATSGPAGDRVAEFAARWACFHQRDLPACHIKVDELPPQHSGLGSGTQLALATAAGLSAFVGLPPGKPAEAAASVGRGLRSAVGAYGFFSGGLIIERGKFSNESLSPLDCRMTLPEDWRFVLARPRDVEGLSGPGEIRAFRELPATPESVTAKLQAELRERLLPAAAQADFGAFAASLHRYGRIAGECFAPVQGGAYNGPVLAKLVETMLAIGGLGAGQSSWGPTLFCLQPHEQAATEFVDRLEKTTSIELESNIVKVDNQGVRLGACTPDLR